MDSEKLASLETKIARYAPVTIEADLSPLSENERSILSKLSAASAYMDSIFLDQAWEKNLSLYRELKQDASESGKKSRTLYEIEMGPWSSLDDQEPFIENVPERPDGANHYPGDMTKEEFETWVAGLSAEDRESARGYFSIIEREPDGGLSITPFNEAYAHWLEPAASLLHEAAALADDPTLRRYLSSRADAFLSNDYYESDVAWMDLDSRIEPTIGPYEVYMDELFNYKASFESYIAVRNEAETNKLKKFGSYLQDIENNLPIDASYRNPKLGSSAPIRVVDLVATGGEARQGVQTAAFNLPNDERVVREKGSKRVMLKNVQEAKFNNVLLPIARTVLPAKDVDHVSFDQFFTHILAHELMHGLGPHNIIVDGRETTVRKEMKELSSALEEAKADIAGLFALQHLMDTGVLPDDTERSLYVTYLASTFRSVRFGINEAHGRGMAVQFNYLIDEGAISFDAESETFSVDIEKVKPAVSKLTGEIMTLQATGDYDGAKKLLDTYGVLRENATTVLNKLDDVPVDIAPTYASFNEE
jgi:hypothetical protein